MMNISTAFLTEIISLLLFRFLVSLLIAIFTLKHAFKSFRCIVESVGIGNGKGRGFLHSCAGRPR